MYALTNDFGHNDLMWLNVLFERSGEWTRTFLVSERLKCQILCPTARYPNAISRLFRAARQWGSYWSYTCRYKLRQPSQTDSWQHLQNNESVTMNTTFSWSTFCDPSFSPNSVAYLAMTSQISFAKIMQIFGPCATKNSPYPKSQFLTHTSTHGQKPCRITSSLILCEGYTSNLGFAHHSRLVAQISTNVAFGSLANNSGSMLT